MYYESEGRDGDDNDDNNDNDDDNDGSLLVEQCLLFRKMERKERNEREACSHPVYRAPHTYLHVPEFSLQVPSLSLSFLLSLLPSLPLPLPFQHRYNRKLDYLQHKKNKYPSPHFSTSLPHYKTSICKQHWLP